MKLIIKILLGFTLISMFACNRTPYYPLSEDVTDMFFFREGSWWLYEDERTKKTDCLYVELSDFNSEIKHFGEYRFDSFLVDYLSKDSIFIGGVTCASNEKKLGYYGKMLFNKIDISLAFVSKVGNYNNDISYTENNIKIEGYQKTETADSIVIITNSLLIKTIADSIIGTSLIKVWRKKNKGMTKLYIVNDTISYTLNLIDSHVIQLKK